MIGTETLQWLITKLQRMLGDEYKLSLNDTNSLVVSTKKQASIIIPSFTLQEWIETKSREEMVSYIKMKLKKEASREMPSEAILNHLTIVPLPYIEQTSELAGRRYLNLMAAIGIKAKSNSGEVINVISEDILENYSIEENMAFKQAIKDVNELKMHITDHKTKIDTTKTYYEEILQLKAAPHYEIVCDRPSLVLFHPLALNWLTSRLKRDVIVIANSQKVICIPVMSDISEEVKTYLPILQEMNENAPDEFLTNDLYVADYQKQKLFVLN